MRIVLLALLAAAPSCATTSQSRDARAPVLRDVEGYAVASCLAHQSEPYLKDQGESWASAIIQRGEGSLDAFSAVSANVKHELAKGQMAVVRVESPSGASDKTLPVLYCSEIIDKPAVRAAIKNAVATLSQAYSE